MAPSDFKELSGMAALSDFQKKKLEHLYNLFYDINKDGKVDWDDFKCAVEKIATLNKWSEDNEKRKSAMESLQLVWDSLKKIADKNADDIVSSEEWLTMWGNCAEQIMTNQQFPYWLSAYMAFMFDMADTSGDNVIDAGEYKEAYMQFGLTSEECDVAFNKATDNGQNALNRELYSKLWHEFFLSDDKEATGNYLFGGSFM